MYTIFICLAIGFIIGLIILLKNLDDFFPMILAPFFLAIIGGIIGLMLALFIPTDTQIRIDTYKLESLQDNNSVGGALFLGCGFVNGGMKYTYYYNKDGGFKMEQVDYNNTLIKYTDSLPKIERYSLERVKNSLLNKFSISLSCGYNRKNVIYVPKGTIKQNYNLDAQ